MSEERFVLELPTSRAMLGPLVNCFVFWWLSPPKHKTKVEVLFSCVNCSSRNGLCIKRRDLCPVFWGHRSQWNTSWWLVKCHHQRDHWPADIARCKASSPPGSVQAAKVDSGLLFTHKSHETTRAAVL